MKAKLYDLMNWAQIEGIVYSEEDRPGTILGPHTVGNSTLYQTWLWKSQESYWWACHLAIRK